MVYYTHFENGRTSMGKSGTAFTQADTISYGYNDKSEVTSAVATNDNYLFDFAPSGNPLNRTTQGQSRTYTFNNLNQFLSVSGTDSTDVTGIVRPMSVEPQVTVNGRSATIDANGNWVANIPLTIGQNTLDIQVVDKFNRTTSDTRRVTLLPPPVFSHDQNGNMTSEGMWQYTWNEENMLVSVCSVSSVVKVENSYDGLGRRRIKKIYNWDTDHWSLITEHRFVYDSWNLVAILNDAGEVRESYVWGVDLSGTLQGAGGVGGLLAVRDHVENKTYYPYYDANGNITAYVDETNNVVAEYTYSPFGKIVRKSGSKADDFNFRFSTKFYDKETELYYFGFRYYSPDYCRFLSRDPIEEASFMVLNGEFEDRNFEPLYVFCSNDPINNTDYLGMFHFYGNWGGPDWTGGLENVQYEDLSPAKQKLLSPPIDEMDACFKKHDLCWSKARVRRDKVVNDKCASEEAKKKVKTQYKHDIDICDKVLDKQLKQLDKDPTKWNPPAPDPKLARKKRRQAEAWF